MQRPKRLQEFWVCKNDSPDDILVFFQNVPDVPNTPECPTADIARSLATVHQICVSHLKELQEMSYSKVML